MSAKAADPWDPAVYERFSDERARPFWDLVGLLHGRGQRSVVDLGCGTGRLTKALHAHLGARHTLGVDSSGAMLSEARQLEVDGLDFAEGDIGELRDEGAFDLVFSNAALHWVPDHRAVLKRWMAAVAPGGELAVQLPANGDHLSHRLIDEIASEEPFLEALGGRVPPDPARSVLAPEEYSVLLDRGGFGEQHVRLQVYAHRLPSASSVVDWVRGTALTRVSSRLSPERFDEYIDRYRQRLVERLGAVAPYLYPFRRILMWGLKEA